MLLAIDAPLASSLRVPFDSLGMEDDGGACPAVLPRAIIRQTGERPGAFGCQLKPFRITNSVAPPGTLGFEMVQIYKRNCPGGYLRPRLLPR